MALTDDDRKVLETVETKGPNSEFGAAGKLQAMLRFSKPTPSEQQRIMTALAKIGVPDVV